VIEDLRLHTDVAAVAMEEAAPVGVSMASMRLPEEVYKPAEKGAPKAEGELTKWVVTRDAHMCTFSALAEVHLLIPDPGMYSCGADTQQCCYHIRCVIVAKPTAYIAKGCILC
jgi:hypothetical protein